MVSRDVKVVLGMFVGVIIAIVLMQTMGDNVNASTVTQTYINQTVTAPSVGTTVNLEGKNYEGSAVVVNGSMVISTNFSLIQLTVNGKQVVALNNTAATSYVGRPINVTYTYQPYGYISTSGGRSLFELVLVIAAIALVVFVVTMLWKKASTQNLMGRRYG